MKVYLILSDGDSYHVVGESLTDALGRWQKYMVAEGFESSDVDEPDCISPLGEVVGLLEARDHVPHPTDA